MTQLNATHGRDYTVYGYMTVNMTYYAQGRLLGDIVGPNRYARVDTVLYDSPALLSVLRAMGADYLLIAHPTLLERYLSDDYITSHFQLVAARQSLSGLAPQATPQMLFRLSETPLAWRLGPELLVNPGFETVTEGPPQRWRCLGEAEVEVSDAAGQNSRAAMRVPAVGSSCLQIVPVTAGKVYWHSLTARGSRPGQRIRLQINWADASEGFLMADILFVTVGESWTQRAMPISAPPNAAYAIVYIHPEDDAPAWWDDVSLRELTYSDVKS